MHDLWKVTRDLANSKHLKNTVHITFEINGRKSCAS